jgi:hypothetical protein
MHSGGVYRARVVETDSTTGKIVVVIPSVTGNSPMGISDVYRKPKNGVWRVPDVGDTVLVASDSSELVNLFIIPPFDFSEEE